MGTAKGVSGRLLSQRLLVEKADHSSGGAAAIAPQSDSCEQNAICRSVPERRSMARRAGLAPYREANQRSLAALYRERALSCRFSDGTCRFSDGWERSSRSRSSAFLDFGRALVVEEAGRAKGINETVGSPYMQRLTD